MRLKKNLGGYLADAPTLRGLPLALAQVFGTTHTVITEWNVHGLFNVCFEGCMARIAWLVVSTAHVVARFTVGTMNVVGTSLT